MKAKFVKMFFCCHFHVNKFKFKALREKKVKNTNLSNHSICELFELFATSNKVLESSS